MAFASAHTAPRRNIASVRLLLLSVLLGFLPSYEPGHPGVMASQMQQVVRWACPSSCSRVSSTPLQAPRKTGKAYLNHRQFLRFSPISFWHWTGSRLGPHSASRVRRHGHGAAILEECLPNARTWMCLVKGAGNRTERVDGGVQASGVQSIGTSSAISASPNGWKSPMSDKTHYVN
jgi:hypothetical protein